MNTSRILAAAVIISTVCACGGGSSGGPNTPGACANVADGTACSTGVCSSGVCVAATVRTVSSTLETVYLQDDGTRVVQAGWNHDTALGATVSALIVPDDSNPAGYKTIPVTVGADSSFSVPGVPFGPYFIQVDMLGTRILNPPDPQLGPQVQVIERVLFEASTSTPDLSFVSQFRQNETFHFAATANVNVQLDLTGLAPITAFGNGVNIGDSLRFASQTGLNAQYQNITGHNGDFSPVPQANDTAIHSQLSWFKAFGVFPDSSAGDVTWVWQRGLTSIGNGATLASAKAFAKVTGFTVTEPAGGSLSAALAPPPQTGSFAGDVRWSRFAALGPAVNPGATPTLDTSAAPSVGFDVVPRRLDFPNQPVGQLPGRFQAIDFSTSAANFDGPETFILEALLSAPAGATADANYGTLAYGQFLDSPWQKTAQILYAFDISLQASGGPISIDAGGAYRALVPRAQLANPVVPQISPPAAPLINGSDAFAFRTGVGTQPKISWSAPAIGPASKYLAYFEAAKRFQTNEVASVTMVLYDRTSIIMPPGVLEAGNAYYGSITAVSSPDRMDDPILGFGSPTFQANTVFGLFEP
jgi:hypothetical protein